MDPHPKWRLRARAALEAYFRKRSFPRFILGLLVIIAGLAGFLISHVLLHHGVGAMALRYPLAVGCGYLVFLGLLRLWVEIERSRCDPRQLDLSSAPPADDRGHPPSWTFPNQRSSWLDWLDVSDLFVPEEGCLIGCALALVLGAIFGAASFLVTFITAAPELLAEVFLDAFVVTMLYRHLKSAAKEHWLGTAVKRTWISALLTAATLGITGACLDSLAPHSHSIGPAVKEILHSEITR